MSDYDSPWKTIIEPYFSHFTAFFVAALHQRIDWSKDPEFLDKELDQIAPRGDSGKRYADKLVIVWLDNGERTRLHIHVEIQSQRELGFEDRMFTYYYRIYDKFDAVKTMSIAILADESPNWRPDSFGYDICGFEIRMVFPSIKLLDYAKDWEALEENPNPFAVVVMAHLLGKKTAGKKEERKAAKLRVTKLLLQRGYSKEDILKLLRFIDWVIDLPEDLEQQFNEEVVKIQGVAKMEYISNFERHNIEKGKLEGIASVLYNLLKERFGNVPAWAKDKIEKADLETLNHWSVSILRKNSIEEVFN
jgi:hypothetical protein